MRARASSRASCSWRACTHGWAGTGTLTVREAAFEQVRIVLAPFTSLRASGSDTRLSQGEMTVKHDGMLIHLNRQSQVCTSFPASEAAPAHVVVISLEVLRWFAGNGLLLLS